MSKVAELLQQGRNDELWQMCCGFVDFDLDQFMSIQKRLLLEQIKLLNRCPLGKKIMRGARPETIEEFREQVPLTTYADYLPELLERREDVLPAKPEMWARTSGKSGEYTCKWIPLTQAYSNELSILMHGLGNLASCKKRGDTSNFPNKPKLLYTVAPRPYMSGTMAAILAFQAPVDYLPAMEDAEGLSFEERVQLGFKQALSRGIEFFFGLSIVLVAAADKFSDSSKKTDIRPLLSQPRALLRLLKGLARSRLARRAMLPRDLWSVKGIISSGLDSWVYRSKIKELWGKYPLDLYGLTEGSIVATQTWDYDTMTFIPNLNFLEFIPEREHYKWRLDNSYQPKTVLLDEVMPGENYEIVMTNFHGGAMVRYRPGDMIRITSLQNEKAGISTPQMVFVGRADDLLDFGVVRVSEKTIWHAIESVGIPYVDWVAYRETGKSALKLYIELKDGYQAREDDVADKVHHHIMEWNEEAHNRSTFRDDPADIVDFQVEVTLLPRDSFSNYTAQRRAEGAELAHLKPPHVNPPERMLSLLMNRTPAVPKVEVTEATSEAPDKSGTAAVQ